MRKERQAGRWKRQADSVLESPEYTEFGHLDISCVDSFWGFPGGACKGNGNPLQDSCLENPMDRGALAGHSPWGRRVGYDLTTKQQEQQVALVVKNPPANTGAI